MKHLSCGRALKRITHVLGFFLCAGCSGPLVGVTVVDERTALENQVLGSYRELDRDVLLLASVRYVDPSGKIVKSEKVPERKREVIRAMQRTSFNKDDVDRLKARGVLGENNQGGITLLAEEKVNPDQLEFVRNLVQEENTDRDVVMRRMIATNEELSESDLPQVRKIFAALNRDTARPGSLIQRESGEWMKK